MPERIIDKNGNELLVGSGGSLTVFGGGYSASNLTTNATTTVKSGAGVLHTLAVNTAGSGSTATIYDNTAGSGTKLATVDTTVLGTVIVYDVAFTTGLTVVTAGAGAADVTVAYA